MKHRSGLGGAPQILLITDRIPSLDNGNGVRVTSVIEGLVGVGALTVLLIDSSVFGAKVQPDERYAFLRLRAAVAPWWAEAMRIPTGVPFGLTYLRTPDLRDSVARLVGGRPWDLVWCSRARVHQVTRGVIAGPRIVDLDDLNDRLLATEIRDRIERKGRVITAPRNARDIVCSVLWRQLQRQIAREVSQVVVCSLLDQQRLGVPNGAIVRNGYPVGEVPLRLPSGQAGKRLSPRAPTILFVGPLTYEPNRLAVDWMIREVMPTVARRVANVKLVVVGETTDVAITAKDRRMATFTGWVPDVAPYYEQATVAVAPLHSGGGTRVKVIEALARGVPIVTTAFACEGHDVAAGVDLLMEDDPRDFAEACIALLSDPSMATRIADAGHTTYLRCLHSGVTTLAVQRLANSVIGGDNTQTMEATDRALDVHLGRVDSEVRSPWVDP